MGVFFQKNTDVDNSEARTNVFRVDLYCKDCSLKLNDLGTFLILNLNVYLLINGTQKYTCLFAMILNSYVCFYLNYQT